MEAAALFGGSFLHNCEKSNNYVNYLTKSPLLCKIFEKKKRKLAY